MVLSARNEAQFEIAKVKGYSVGVEFIVRLPDKVKPGTDLQLLECLWAIPIAESGNVEITDGLS